MKAFSKTLLGMALALTATVSYSKQNLVVWEDNSKSFGIESAVRDFKSMYNCDVTVLEKSSVEHLNEYIKAKEEGKETPDVFIIISDRVGEAVSLDLVSPLAFMNADRNKYAESAVTPFNVNHEIYACPRSIETLVIYYNKDVMDYPFETFDEYIAFARQRKAQNGYGLIAKLDNFYFSYGFLSGFGGYVFGRNSDGNFNAKDIGLNNDGCVRGLVALADYANNYLPPVLLTDAGWGEIDQMFISGKAAAVITGPWSLESYSKAGVNYGLAPLPKLSNGNAMNPFYGVKGYAVGKDSKEKQLAEKFIAFINQPKYALERYSRIAELPPILDVMSHPLIVNDDFANALSLQILHADPMPSIPEMGRVWGAMGDALNAVIKDHADAKASLDKAAAVVLGEPVQAEQSAPAEEAPAEETATTEEAPSEETATATTEEAPSEETATTEEAPSEETATTEEAPSEETATVEEAPAEEAPAEETAVAEAAPAEDVAVTEEAPAAQ